MTIDKPQSGTRTTEQPPRQDGPAEKHPRDANPETEDDKIRREQATNPALMPIGDPAGAA